MTPIICPACGHRIACPNCDHWICEACGCDLAAKLPFGDEMPEDSDNVRDAIPGSTPQGVS